MAPEQLEGREADPRTDIFALGALIHEMVTGKKAFEGKSQASLIAAILDAQPDPISSQQPLAPAALDHVVHRCLAKNPDERWQSAYDVACELRWIAEGGSAPQRALEAPVRPRRTWRAAIAYAFAGAGVGAAIALLATLAVSRGSDRSPRAFRVAVPLPATGGFANPRPNLAISPDGSLVVFVQIDGGVRRLFQRPLDRFEATPVRGTENAEGPFFSPDGQWIGFFVPSETKLKRVALAGGAAIAIATATDVRGAAWGPGDTIVYTDRLDSGLWRVPAAGGTPARVTTPDAAGREKTHRFPEFLPDGKTLLFTIGTHDITSFADARIAVVPLQGGKPKVLIEGGSFARYAASGHIVYSRGDVLMGVPFDASRLEVTGPPAPVLEGVSAGTDFGRAEFAVARDGTLVYVPGGDTAVQGRLAWADRTGTVTPVSDVSRLFLGPMLSPDGQRILVRVGGANDMAWLYDLRRHNLSRLTFKSNVASAAWMPDGQRIAVSVSADLAWVPTDGSGQEEALYRDEFQKGALTMSPDGAEMLFQTTRPDTGIDIWALTLKDRKVRPVVSTRFSEGGPTISPDGRWFAYWSNETGRPEVYVRSLSGPGVKTPVSIDGGTPPIIWRRDGRELVFRNGARVMAVDVRTEGAFDVGTPRVLFTLPATVGGPFDMAPDGRLLVVQNQPLAPPTQINLIVGWLDELRRAVAPRR